MTEKMIAGMPAFEYGKLYREKNKEKHRIRRAKWYQDNKDRISAQQKEYRAPLKEFINKAKREKRWAKFPNTKKQKRFITESD